jgi:tetratricopeptide (TPR) repeat protein
MRHSSRLLASRTVAAVTSCALLLPSVALAHPLAATPARARMQPAADPAAMTDEQKLERAKQLFGEGQALIEAGDAVGALAKFEEAYFKFAPQFHVMNFNIGSAAYTARDCVKAEEAFQRFLDLVPEHPERGTTQEKLVEIRGSGCAEQQRQQAAAAAAAAQQQQQQQQQQAAAPVYDDEEAPMLESNRSKREQAAEREIEDEREGKMSGLMIGGIVMTALGGGAMIGGGVALALASSTATELADLAGPEDATTFPAGNYAEDDVFDKDRNVLPAQNAAGIGLLAGGGALLVVGVALIAVDVSKKKGSKRAEQRRGPRLVNLSPAVGPQGAGASARFRF